MRRIDNLRNALPIIGAVLLASCSAPKNVTVRGNYTLNPKAEALFQDFQRDIRHELSTEEFNSLAGKLDTNKDFYISDREADARSNLSEEFGAMIAYPRSR